VITLGAEWLRDRWDELSRTGFVPVRLSEWDGSDAFTLADLGPLPSPRVVTGTVILGVAGPPPDSLVVVRLVQSEGGPTEPNLARFAAPDGRTYALSGEFLGSTPPKSLRVEIVSVTSALAERRLALLESTMLGDACVLIVGLGTGGISVALELAKAGVGHFMLVDGDRLSVGNVSRHHAGVSHAGRKKVYAARDLILEKNPAATIVAEPQAAGAENEDAVRALVRRSNVVVSAVDHRPSKLFLNRLCIAESRSAVYGGAFRRAYGGQVLRVRPHRSPCYQCFVMAMPEKDEDFEIASERDSLQVAYSDRPTPIEPGLSLDVAPLSTMVARLTLNELVLGKPTPLAGLERDFSAPWYLWINRPEAGTQYARLPPLSDSADEMTIMRWYGIELDREPGCPACGDFRTAAQETYGLTDLDLPDLPERPSGISDAPVKE